MIFILALPLLYTIPIFFFSEPPISWPLNSEVWNFYKRITFADILLLIIIIKSIPQVLKFKLIKIKKFAPFFIFQFFLLFIAIFHYYSSNFNSTNLFMVLRMGYIIVLFIAVIAVKNFNVKSKHYAILLYLFLSVILIFSIFTKISLFNYLPTYAGYLDILVWRFRGLSPNTNNFIAGVFCSFTIFCLFKNHEQKYDFWDLSIFLILITLAFLTKGRNSGLLLILIASLTFHKLKLSMVSNLIIIIVFFLNLFSLRFDILPSKSSLIGFNLSSSSYTLAHDPYLRIAKKSNFFGNSKSTILEILPKNIEKDRILNVANRRGLVGNQKVSYVKYFTNYVSPLSLFYVHIL